AGAHPGLDVHLIGATVVYLMFGTRLAVVSLAIAALGAGLAAHEPLEVIGLHWLLWAGVPLLASASAVPWAERRLPAHPFVFLWGYGFVVSGLAVGASGLAQVLVYGVLQALPWPVLTDDYLPFFLLLGWSEAFTAGALLTLRQGKAQLRGVCRHRLGLVGIAQMLQMQHKALRQSRAELPTQGELHRRTGARDQHQPIIAMAAVDGVEQPHLSGWRQTIDVVDHQHWPLRQPVTVHRRRLNHPRRRRESAAPGGEALQQMTAATAGIAPQVDQTARLVGREQVAHRGQCLGIGSGDKRGQVGLRSPQQGQQDLPGCTHGLT
ncbi:MAG: hypothetical protein EBT40_03850, partial [Betaproteobacteria bacterium]|nr:hypothetical protein [Betaproteobacteria bacterium]